MSVVKSEQGESRVQFLETGRNIYKAVMALCVKLPKRYTFYIGRSIYETARVYPAQPGLLCHAARNRLFQLLFKEEISQCLKLPKVVL